MKSVFAAAAVVAALGFTGAAFAEDAMATPMEGDAMAGDAMAGDGMMTAEHALHMCLAEAAKIGDAMTKDAGEKLCHDSFDMAAMSGDAMEGDAMQGGGM